MELYNKVMVYFWLLLSIVSAVIITYMGFAEGFDRWSYYYTVPVIAIMMFLVKKWMMNRMKKHLEYMNEKNKGK